MIHINHLREKYITIFKIFSHQKQPLRGVLKKRCSENMQQFMGEYPCRSVISIKLQSNFIEIALRHGCSPVNLLHIFRTPFPRNTSGWLLFSHIIRHVIPSYGRKNIYERLVNHSTRKLQYFFTPSESLVAISRNNLQDHNTSEAAIQRYS